MSRKEARPPLGGLSMDDDVARIRDFGLSRGFLPTDPQPPPAPGASLSASVATIPTADFASAAAPPAAAPVVSAGTNPLISRPAATRPWQAMLPDYLVEALRQTAAAEGTAQKVVVLRALKAAGFRVDDIDLQDLRKR